MDFIELANSRKSVRAFKDGEVTTAQVERLLEAARLAPSGGNCQPWHFYVIRRKNVVARMLDNACHQPFIAAAQVVIVVCAEPERSGERYHERGRTLYCLHDTGAAIQNLLLCAAEMGLGACWCGSFDEAALSEALAIPAERRPVAVIPVGIPAHDPQARGRRSISEITTYID